MIAKGRRRREPETVVGGSLSDVVPHARAETEAGLRPTTIASPLLAKTAHVHAVEWPSHSWPVLRRGWACRDQNPGEPPVQGNPEMVAL
jgi:hypothetical protein